MSKAYLALKNFSWPEMVNLLCYGAKHPETLSQTQRITRLYRATVRRYNTLQLENFRGDYVRFHDQLYEVQQDFYRLEQLNQGYANLSSEEKTEFKCIEEKWVKWQESKYDAFLYVEECRPYASTSTRYVIPGDDELSFDPIGYYKPRLLSDNRPEKELPFFRDYPQNDSHWMMEETFPDNREAMSDCWVINHINISKVTRIMQLSEYSSCSSDILELDGQLLISWVFQHTINALNIRQYLIINDNTIIRSHTVELKLKFGGLKQTVIKGFVERNFMCSVIGTQSGVLLKISDKVTEYIVGAAPIVQISQFIDNFLMILSENQQINLYDTYTNTTLVLFNEFLSTPIRSIRVRCFFDTIVHGSSDGQLTYYKVDDRIIHQMEKAEQSPKQITIHQSLCRIHVTKNPMLDFLMYGEMIITLQQGVIQLLYVDTQTPGYILIKSIPTVFYLNMTLYNDKLFIGDDYTLVCIILNTGNTKILNKFISPTKYNYLGILTYVQDNKLYI